MADDAGRVISFPRPNSMLVVVLVVVAVSASTTSLCVAAPDAGTAKHAGGGATRGMFASRFVATAVARKMGGACRAGENRPARACSGAGLRCCGRACTDVLASASNCGACGNRCPYGQLCCGGRCVAVAYDSGNCGACGRACAAGLPCTYGMCGYA
ncbi:stigma-specific STIG1-like protein 2 [Phragmites australis]|uniref:stigma-specific STIG1-like protein 2 n=1 Tax=Phragmites australis TaxID=29695 RepID=UPI002D782FFA|nr:stigma-specific STIG1-like protein 2 [Phragmites australis]